MTLMVRQWPAHSYTILSLSSPVSLYVDLSSVQPQIASIISGAKENGDTRQTAGWPVRVRHDDGTCEEEEEEEDRRGHKL